MNCASVSRARRWSLPAAISALVLAFLFTFADREAFVRVAAHLSWPALLLGILLLQGEGLTTAFRLRQLAPAGTGMRSCLAVTGRWVAALALLPARLGELYGLHLLSRRLGQPFGESLNNLFVQRLFDAIVLALLGVVALVFADARQGQPQLMCALLALAATLMLIAWRLPWCFACVAVSCRRWRRHGVGRTLLRAALHGRRGARATVRGRQPLALALSSAIKWLCNLGGIVTLMLGTAPVLHAGSAGALAIIGNLAAVLPLSGLGGVGLSDLTLAGGLAWYGLDTASIAATTLYVRVLLLAAPLLFALLVVLSEQLWPHPPRRVPAVADAR